MTVLDIIILVITGIYIVKGFFKGIIVEFFIFAGFFAGIIGAMKFTHAFIGMLPETISQSKGFNFIAYFIVFIGIFILLQYMGKIIGKGIKIIQLNFLNRIAGAAFGFIKIIFFLSLMLWLFDSFDFLPLEQKQESVLHEPLVKFAPRAISTITAYLPYISDIMTKIEETINGLSTFTGNNGITD